MQFSALHVERRSPMMLWLALRQAFIPHQVAHRNRSDQQEPAIRKHRGPGDVVLDEEFGQTLQRPVGMGGQHFWGHQIAGSGFGNSNFHDVLRLVGPMAEASVWEMLRGQHRRCAGGRLPDAPRKRYRAIPYTQPSRYKRAPDVTTP